MGFTVSNTKKLKVPKLVKIMKFIISNSRSATVPLYFDYFLMKPLLFIQM